MSELSSTDRTTAIKSLLEAVPAHNGAKIRQLAAANPEVIRGVLSDETDLSKISMQHQMHPVRTPPEDLPSLHDHDPVKTRAAGGRERREWRDMVDALIEAGFELPSDAPASWARKALVAPMDTATLDWMLAKGSFDENFLREIARARSESRHRDGYGQGQGAHGLVKSFVAEGLEEMATLGRLLAAGVAGGKHPLFGITDLACEGLFLCAQRLADLGEKPRPGLATLNGAGNGLGPVEAYVASLSPYDGHKRENQLPDANAREEAAQRARAGLRKLVEWGAELSPAPPVEAPARETERLSWEVGGKSMALAALLGHGPYSPQRAISKEALNAVGQELIDLGADLNDGPLFAHRIANLFVCQDLWGADWTNFEAEHALQWASDHGLDFAKHAATLQAAVAAHVRHTKAWELSERFAALGAKPSLIKASDPSPIQFCLEKDQFGNISKFIAAGAPMDYVDQNGEGALHFLSNLASKRALENLALFLEKPQVLALIDLPSQDKERLGMTPLHRACAALNKTAIELLLAAGANPNAQDAQGWTPLRHLLRKTGAKAKKTLPLLKLLLASGADPSIRDAKGLTPAQAAAAKAPLGILGELLELRPEEVGGEDAAAVQTKKKLRKRGGQGLSIAEHADLAQVLEKAKATRDSDAENPGAVGSGGDSEAPSMPKRRVRSL